MKYYHLTIIRNGKHQTIFGEMSSIAAFLLFEKEVGHETFILYSREMTQEEYQLTKKYT